MAATSVRGVLCLDLDKDLQLKIKESCKHELTSSVSDPCVAIVELLDTCGDALLPNILPTVNASLRVAAFMKNFRVFKSLLSFGGSWAARNRQGLTAVHFAAAANHLLSLCPLLARARADDSVPLSSLDNGPLTPLHAAAAFGSYDALRLLLAEGAGGRQPLPWRFGSPPTPLHVAAAGGHASCVRELLASGVPVDTPAAPCAVSALFIAACNEHLECVDMLLEAGAGRGGQMIGAGTMWQQEDTLCHIPFEPLDAAGRPVQQLSPLEIMAYFGLAGGVRTLLTHIGGAGPSRCRSLTRALYYAVLAGGAAVVQLLLQAGAKPNGIDSPPLLSWKDRPPMTPFAMAVAKKLPAVATLLLNAGALPTDEDLTADIGIPIPSPEQQPAQYVRLALACRAGDAALAVRLLDGGAPAGGWSKGRGGSVYAAKQQPWDLLSPLAEAVRAGHGDLVQVLLDRGVPLHFLGSRMLCLFGVVEAERPCILALLLKQGGKLFQRGDLEYPLQRARERLAAAGHSINVDASKVSHLVELLVKSLRE